MAAIQGSAQFLSQDVLRTTKEKLKVLMLVYSRRSTNRRRQGPRMFVFPNNSGHSR